MHKRTSEELEKKVCIALSRFEAWLADNGCESFDQYDFWASKIGVTGKKAFLKNKFVGGPIVIILQALESFFPSVRNIFAKRRRFAIGDAHFALGFVNLFRYYRDKRYLDHARNITDQLIVSAEPTESGIGWGYPYVWATENAVYPEGTPFITVTPYCFYAVFIL